MNLFNFNRKKIQGFVYSPEEETDLFKNAQEGHLINKKEKKPPYIVVDHELVTKIVTMWPGKLFLVEVINQSKEKGINKGLIKNPNYTRTFGVKIIKEVPIGQLFGDNGQKISRIIDLTRSITKKQVNSLSENAEQSVKDLFTKAWRNWILMTDKDYAYLDDDHHNTLQVSRKNESSSSPIMEGLSIISSQFDIRARELVGESAFGVDEDGEIYLKPIWAKACEKLLHAGMSYAEDNILTEAEREKLRNPVVEILKV